ncbi:protoporphyrinogen oxidase [Branchiibius sp. NY16-3462-2]|uniref:protoporphyrinogen oxidase n=1 Tax=Branchiibius sp. NY16-3462-2 TaxID=1807500 RepID=UPI000792F879|nr:protoporphyrinogen oxidase [Branchiibius sp. NY16-3462-2]KYH44101.1 hypothetical protein AZH51_05025 [Branchiibius sp. NY16-3462-2]
MADIVVVGAGITGLAAAERILHQEPGADILVLEGSPRVGGKLHIGELAGQQIDLGAEAVLARRPEAVALIDQLGLTRESPAAVGASLWSRGALRAMPQGTLMGIPSDAGALTEILDAGEVARAAAEQPVQIDGDLSLGSLVQQALGPAVVDRLIEPLLGGVYAGDARALSARACLPAAYDEVASGGTLTALAARAAAAPRSDAPVFASLAGGIGGLPIALAQHLAAKGVTIETDAMVRELRSVADGFELTVGSARSPRTVRASAIVLAAPAAPTSRLLGDIAPAAAQALAAIDYASMVLVSYAFERGTIPGDTSGFLVPPIDGRDIKASTFSSAKWPWLRQALPAYDVVRVSFGRAGEVRTLQRTDEDLAAAGLADLSEALGRPLPAPVDTRVQRWGGGLPQYAVGHLDRVAAVRADLPQGLAVAGAAYDGVGIPACIASARRASEELLTRVSGTTQESEE